MAVQAFPYLVMTDGTLTVTFADGLGGASSFAPLRGTWAPSIATRRRSTFGRGPWDEVIEEWDLIIKGADAATALSNLETLTRLLDNADRWWRLGEAVSPVLLKYTPQGSTLFTTANPATCVILGRADGDETNLNLPAEFNDVGMLFEIRPIRLRFLRAGQWLNPTVETTAQTSNAANPTVQGANFASTLAISSPIKVTADFSVSGSFGNGLATAPAILLTATATSRLQIYEAESASFGGSLTSVADAAGKARGGSVARFTPVSTASTQFVIDTSGGGFDQTSRRVALWAPVRNNSATTSFTVQCSAVYQNIDTTVGSVVAVDTSSLNPRMLFLGILSTRSPVQKIRVTLTPSAAAGTLDIDYLCIQAIDDECSGAVALYGAGATIGTITMTAPGSDPTIIDPRPLEFPTPINVQTAQSNLLSYAGDAYLMSRGQAYAAVWLATSGTFWRMVNAANALCDTAFTASRYNGYLSPR